MKCKGTTKAGKPCRASAKHGETLCSAHLGVVGRPTRLDADTEEVILLSVRSGNSFTAAAAAAGIGRTTFASWRERGEAGVEPYSAFLHRLTRARAEGRRRLIALISNAAEQDWRAALAMLERMYPDEWGRRDRHEHTGKGGGPIVVSGDDLRDPAVRKQAHDLIARAESARAERAGGPGPGD